MAALSNSCANSGLGEIFREPELDVCKTADKGLCGKGNAELNTTIPVRLQDLSLKQDTEMSVKSSEKSSQQTNLLQVTTEFADFEGSDMRPRAKTIPSTWRALAPLTLPEIKVEDFSDSGGAVEPADTEKGTFTVFSSPPRRRANTCPDDLFRRRKNGRPPTPPPFLQQKGHLKGRSKFNFQKKKLTQLAEDNSEPANPSASSSISATHKLLSGRQSHHPKGLDQPTKIHAGKGPINGYTFTGSKTTYIARPALKASYNSPGNIKKDFTPVGIRGTTTHTEGQPSHVRSWTRSWETEVTS